jgi:DNA-binding MarR family transcriptional regulator
MGRERTAHTEMTSVADSVDRLSMWLRRQVPAAVSSSTITTLDTLHAHGPLRVSELAEREAVSQPGMTTLINRLEAAGQAVRTPDPTDGRAALVAITEEGRAILRERHSSRVALLVEELMDLDPADRAALVAAVPAIDRLITRTSITKESVSA